MQPARGIAAPGLYGFGDGGRESQHVMAQFPLQLVDPWDGEGGVGTQVFGGGYGYDPSVGEGLCGSQLDAQPALKFGLVRP